MPASQCCIYCRDGCLLRSITVGIVKEARRRGIRSFRPIVDLPYTAKGSHGTHPCSIADPAVCPRDARPFPPTPPFSFGSAMGPFLYAICQDANPLLLWIAVRADLSQMLVKTAAGCKKRPRKTGAMVQIIEGWIVRRIAPVRRSPVFSGSETETREVTVADGNAAAGGQQAVDGSHQTAEQGAGGQEADGCSLGHVCPLFLVRNHSASDLGTIYVYQMPATTDLFA